MTFYPLLFKTNLNNTKCKDIRVYDCFFEPSKKSFLFFTFWCYLILTFKFNQIKRYSFVGDIDNNDSHYFNWQ